MDIVELLVGPVQTNCYIASGEGSSSCVVIDPGDEPDKIAEYIKKKNMKCEGILLTHGHFDHITGVEGLVSLTGASIYAYEGEKDLMMSAAKNGCGMMGYTVTVQPDILLKDGQQFSLAGLEFEVVHTPGHTIGSCCYYAKKDAVLFSGDTVFMESVGRTDFPTGSSRQLIDSIREKIFVLPDDVKIYPGHGPETSVGYEKQYNPFA